MNSNMFSAMKEQMTPSAAAQAALTVKLTQAAPAPRAVHWGRYAALAACAALLIAAYPIYQSLKPQTPALHGYVTVEGSNTEITKQTAAEGAPVTGRGEDSGDRDQAMTPGELTEAMEEVGFSTEDIDAYQALGYQMTWAKWWKFVDRQRNSEGAEPFNLASLEAFSREELAPNTGDLTNEPVADIPSQPGADAYQLLMDHFGGAEPDWYGGAYVEKNGSLMVLLVNDKNPGDKTLELEVLDAVGRNAPVGFTGAKYSRSDLERLNKELTALMDGDGIFTSWGIYDDQNRIILDFFETPPDDLLAGLARLDPDGDAILVRVVEAQNILTESQKGPAPVDAVGEEDSGGIDVAHIMPGGATVGDDSDQDLEATEPYDDDDKMADLQTREPAIEEPAVAEPAVEEAQPPKTENAD